MILLLRPFLFVLAAFAVIPAAFAADDGKIAYADGDKLPAISDTLFKTGILSTDDPAAIEEYIRIHHCGIYEQYSRDDFAWARIRETQARDLELKMPTMPEGLEISSGLRLTQYDLGNNEFMIATEEQMNNMGLVTIFNDPSGSFTPCMGNAYNSFVPRMHPLTLVVKVDKPISLTGVPMTRAAGDELISLMNKRRGNEAQKRQVTMVLRLRVTGIDPLSGSTDKLRRTVLGTLDELRIYESPERKILLYKRDFKTPADGKSKI